MDPHQNFMKWGEMARKFLGNDFWGDMMETMPSSGPKADVFHGKDEVLVLVDLPGVEDINQIQLRVEDDALLIKGRLNPRHTHYQANLQERFYGDFERRIKLGTSVVRKNSSARYRKGILEVRLLRAGMDTDFHTIRIRD